MRKIGRWAYYSSVVLLTAAVTTMLVHWIAGPMAYAIYR